MSHRERIHMFLLQGSSLEVRIIRELRETSGTKDEIRVRTKLKGDRVSSVFLPGLGAVSCHRPLGLLQAALLAVFSESSSLLRVCVQNASLGVGYQSCRSQSAPHGSASIHFASGGFPSSCRMTWHQSEHTC